MLALSLTCRLESEAMNMTVLRALIALVPT